ncbi:immunoglobulin-like domain-containing protein, partial [Polaribacter sp.]|uniref:DUF5011 domain-containing protein n=1 Tax=Polaribacter sp. TaxID=1920175 RepID=UPI00260D44D0
STTVALEFAPSQTGSFNENISIRNNSPEEQQIINVLANVFSPNYLSISDTSVFRENSYEIPLNLVNNENIRAVQYDLNIPEGFIFDLDNVVESSILNNFTTSISSLGNNNYRFLIYTVSNDFINSGDETILLLPIFVENTIDLGQYTFEISNVVLSSESNNQNISSEALRVGYIDVIEDTTIPVITITGDATVTIEVGSTYTDAGATALDNYDGDITDDIVTVNTVDTSTVGTYTVTYDVSDANNNDAVQVIRTVNVDSNLSINDNIKNNLKIYPNPTKNSWKISASIIIESIEIYDIVGRKVLSINPKSKDYEINCTSFSNGVYILVLNNKKVSKLIKE